MNAKELLALIDECGMIELVNRSGRDSDGWIQETILRALRLLAAAERNDGSTPETDVAGLVKVMREAAADYMLCYTPDGDVDQARLRDNANYFGMHYNAAAIALESLAARVGELEAKVRLLNIFKGCAMDAIEAHEITNQGDHDVIGALIGIAARSQP